MVSKKIQRSKKGGIRIAFIGTKGLPAKWGGIEKYIEELGKRLVLRGHEVTVFGSRWYCNNDMTHHLGMRIRKVPTIRMQATDALTNAFFSSMVMIFEQYDIVHFHGYASYFFVPFIKRIGKKTVVTAHGMESGWNNPKYGPFARQMIKTAFRSGVGGAHYVTAVSRHILYKIRKDFQIHVELLSSGLEMIASRTPRLIEERYGLQERNYLLFLGRIDPIKRVEWLLTLAKNLPNDIRIVIAGDAQNAATETYLGSLKARSKNDPRIIFTGPVTGALKEELFSNCLLFLAPSMDEGLPITLLEASSYGRCAVASDIPAHREVIADGVTGFLFPSDDQKAFSALVTAVLSRPRDDLIRIGLASQKKAYSTFNWEKTAEKAETLYQSLLD